MNKEKKKEEKAFSVAPYIAIAGLMFGIVVTAYIINFQDTPISKDSGTWGTFGDFIGGTLNPILAFLSFIALLCTIQLQSKELKASREELEMTRDELARSADAQKEQSESIKLQNFENTFFNMLNLHNEIVRNISIIEDLKFSYQILDRKNKIENPNKVIIPKDSTLSSTINGREAIIKLLSKLDSFISTNKMRMFTPLYDLCHDATQVQLGHYFGNIYQILKFISSNKELIDAKKYSDLFRAQFSSSELKLLFYHCTGEIGSKKFKKYLEEFHFLEHLVLEKENKNFEFILCSQIYENSAFGNKKEIDDFINETKIALEKWKNHYEAMEKNYGKDLKKYEAMHYFYIKKQYDNALEILNEESKTNPQNNLIKEVINEIKNEIAKTNTSFQEQQ